MSTEPSGKPDSFATEDGETGAQSLFTLIEEQPFFKGLDAHQLQLLADSAMRMQFQAGQSIFEAGSPANRFYLILEGKVVLELEASKGARDDSHSNAWAWR